MPWAFPKMVPQLLTTAILLLVSSTTTLASTLPKKARAHSGGGGGEGNLRASTTTTSHARQNSKHRRLGKSGKSSYYGKSGKAAYDMDYSHHHYHDHDEISYEDIPPHDHDAADIPYDTRGEKNLEVTMGGKLLTSNLNVMSDDDLTLLANAFDQTILHFLDDGYEADVYMIGAKSVGGGTESYVSAPSIDLFDRRRNRRILQSSSSSSDDDVLFNVRISKPCPDCTKETATVYGSQLFREAFGELMEKADSGELTATFCIFANAANVITEPCQVDIASVKGTSLKMGFKMDTGVPTPPDNLPIPMPTPQDHFPTYSPSTSVVEEGVPTYSPMATGGGIPTYAPTTSGDGMLTTAPSLPPATTSGIPTYAPTTGGASASPTLPSIGVTLAPATLPPGDTATPSTAPPAGSGDIPTYAPTTGGSTLAPVTLPPGTTATPSTAPPAGSGDVPTYAPTVGGSTLAPVTLPPGTTATPSTAPPAGSGDVPTYAPTVGGSTLAPVTLPPGTTATPSTAPPASGTLLPVTLPPGTTATPSTVPPATGTTLAPVTLPPGTTATPSTLPPATGTLAPVTLPPGTTATPSTLPPATGTLAPVTLPPGTTATPSTLPPATSTLLPVTLPPGTTATPSTLPPATGSTLAPLTLPPGTTATPSTTLPALGTLSPASASTSAAPSLIPAGALYYDGFEQGSFLTATPEWTSQGDGLWELTTERANSGVYSIKSPALLVPDDYTQKTSNVTLLTNPAWPGGNLMFSILGGANMPFDDVIYYVDDVQIGQASEMTAFESREIPLEAGGHVITFSYKINPAGIDTFPPLPLDRIGAAFIDDVYFLPEGVTAPPSSSSIASRPPSSSIPGMSSVVPAPVSLSSNVPVSTHSSFIIRFCIHPHSF
jgi:hypothetical protein